MRLFFISLLLSFSAIAQEGAPTIIRSKRCIARSTACRYTNFFESSNRNTPNSCTMSYGYVTQEKVTVVKADGTIVVLPDLEEKIHQKTFERSFHQNTPMSQADWAKYCASPCESELSDLKVLTGECK